MATRTAASLVLSDQHGGINAECFRESIEYLEIDPRRCAGLDRAQRRLADARLFGEFDLTHLSQIAPLADAQPNRCHATDYTV
jgi:hypothetical protein